MNWITTNIRFSEEDYMRLKIEAAQRRKSLAAIVRERVSRKIKNAPLSGQKILQDLKILAKKMPRFSKGLI